MDPKEAEELVRERWERVYGGGEIAVTVYAEEKACHFLNYIAAAEFTKQREEEIRQARKARKLLAAFQAAVSQDDHARWTALQYLYGLLDGKLAALLVGWKEKP